MGIPLGPRGIGVACAITGALSSVALAQTKPPFDSAIDVQTFEYAVGPKTFVTIADGDIIARGQFAADALPKSLTVDGVCWIGANIATVSNLNASDCTVHITGALMTGPSVSGVSAKYDGLISVTFDTSKVQVPNFSRVGATPKSVKILRWGI